MRQVQQVVCLSVQQLEHFDWKKHNMFCAEDCDIDPHHPDRRRIFEFHTSDCKHRKTFKGSLSQNSSGIYLILKVSTRSLEDKNETAIINEDCKGSFW